MTRDTFKPKGKPAPVISTPTDMVEALRACAARLESEADSPDVDQRRVLSCYATQLRLIADAARAYWPCPVCDNEPHPHGGPDCPECGQG